MDRLKHGCCVAVLLLLSLTANAASKVLYFPANYDANSSGSPADVTDQGDFASICQSSNGVRLPGLDAVRSFAGASTCTVTAPISNFNPEVDYVFLIDDTSPLSAYLQTQMRQQNLLQAINGREVMKPSVINFSADGSRDAFNILVVGETAYQQLADDTAWFAALDDRFAIDQQIAGRASNVSNEIWFAYHGMYFNKLGEWLESVGLDQVVQFFEKQLEELAKGAVTGASTGATSSATLAAPPTFPPRPLNDYMKQCFTNSVPLPPVWNPKKGKSKWKRRGVLSKPFAAVGLPKVEVWTFDSASPKGVCFALPRMSKGGNIDTDIGALGIICQSETTGKACFWDNVERPAGNVSSGQTDEKVRRKPGRAKIKGTKTQGLDPVNMSDGYNLEENCTACHRGSNVFLIQEGTPLEVNSVGKPKLDTDPAKRYQPISGKPPSAVWANPTSTIQPKVEAATADTQCTNCHSINGNNNFDNELTEISVAYCATVLKGFIGVNMPPISKPADWAVDYLDEVKVLSNECCKLGVDLKLKDTKGKKLNTTCP